MGWTRSHEHGGRGRMPLQVMLDDDATERYANHHGGVVEPGRNLLHIGNIIPQSRRCQRVPALTSAVTTQADGMGCIAVISEEWLKVRYPDARTGECTMNKKKGCPPSNTRRFFRNHLKLHNFRP